MAPTYAVPGLLNIFVGRTIHRVEQHNIEFPVKLFEMKISEVIKKSKNLYVSVGKTTLATLEPSKTVVLKKYR